MPSVNSGKRFGTPKFAWLNRLKNSLRNATVWPSRGRNVLTRDRFRLNSFGPIKVLRPRFPYVPAAGNTKAAGSYHLFTFPIIGLFEAPGFKLGRSGVSVFWSFERLNPS